MRSNGVGHLRNDTFVAATRDDTENMYLVTSKLTEGCVTPYPLARRVHFFPCSEVTSLGGAASSTSEQQTSSGEAAAAKRDGLVASHSIQHSLHPSVDGKFVAAISSGRCRHYLVEIMSGRVCEFTTRVEVVSVAWHPTNTTSLLLLQATGILLVLRVDTPSMRVVFKDRREVHLKNIIAEFKDYVVTGGAGDSLTAQLEDPRGRKRETLKPSEAPLAVKEEAAATAVENGGPEEEAAATAEVATRSGSNCSVSPEGSTGSPSASPPSAQRQEGSQKWGEGQERQGEGTRASAKATDGEASMAALEGAAHTARGAPDESEDALIGMCVIPASRSLPVMLLVLCRSGDIFSLKLDAEGMPASLAKEYDGRVDTIWGEEPVPHRDVGPHPCVHYLVRGGAAAVGYDEAPLAIGTALLDEDVGRHVVIVVWSSGVVRGSWFSEPDLLCRDLMRPRMEVTIHLDAALRQQELTSSHVSRLVSVQTCGNTTLIRYGDAAYVCVWAVWSRRAAAWVYRDVGAEGCQRVPVVGRSAAIPEPLALRLPYDVTDASVAVGVNDIVIVPEVATQAQPCARSKLVVVKVASLLLAAIYARGERYSLTYDATGTSVATADDKSVVDGARHNNLERLLELTAECYQQWICGYPHDTIDISTAALAQRVQDTHAAMRKRHESMQEREGRLADRVACLTQKQQEMAQDLAHAQNTVRDAVLHRRGIDAIYAANETLGKVHTVLKELEAVAAQREASKEKAAGTLLA